MNRRYAPIKTDRDTIKVLDTIIRFPYSTDLMTREARVIRESIPNLARALLGSEKRAALVCKMLGHGWESSWPDVSFVSKQHISERYKESLITITNYLEENKEIYTGLVIFCY